MPTASLLSLRARLGWVVLALVLALLSAGVSPRSAAADQTQVSILQDDPMILSDPTATLLRARQLGVEVVRVMLRWQDVAPAAESFKRPAGLDAADPADYSAAAWAPYDAAIEDAGLDGITIDLDVVGGAPLWATGPGMPKTSNCPCNNWDPSASALGQFVRALGTRYSGNYDPVDGRLEPGNPIDLPRVSFWSLWNEPDYGPSLAPQGTPGNTRVEESPRLYRALVDQAWTALGATGHARDTILIGELAPRGTVTFGNFNGMTPLQFVRALYCVNSAYQPLRGAAARERSCPTTPAASKQFVSQNPGLFHASGFSDHPYMRWYPPDREENVPATANFARLLPNYASLAEIGHLETGLDRALGAYGSRRKYPIWNTEFGYITSPPKKPTKKDHYPWVSPAVAAQYDNWAEYLSWKNPRIQSFDQYLLEDALPALPSNDEGGFASGLLFYGGRQKADYGAFRMPLFLPKTTAASPAQPLEVWGAVKPAHFALLDLPAQANLAQVLFAPSGSSDYTPIATIAITSSQGYFDQRIVFPSSGTVVVSWSYPDDAALAASGYPVYSRPVHITVK